MKKWIYYGGMYLSFLGGLLVASGMETYRGWGAAACFFGSLGLFALTVILAGLGNCAQMEEAAQAEEKRQSRKAAEGSTSRKAG